MNMEKIGEWAFIVCVVIAILAGLTGSMISASVVVPILAVLGVIVGLINLTEKETTPFLVAALALMVAGSSLSAIPTVAGTLAENIVSYIVAFVAPASVIVGLKAVYSLGKKK